MSFVRSSASSLRPQLSRLPHAPLLLARRYAHKEVDVVYEYTVPFSYRRRRAFAVKCFTFLTTAFAIPFIAAGYQLRKSGATAA